MDFTQFGTAPGQPQRSVIQPTPVSSEAHQENLEVPQSEEAKAFRKTHFDITNSGGQVKAGIVDTAQEEFLKHTKFVK